MKAFLIFLTLLLPPSLTFSTEAARNKSLKEFILLYENGFYEEAIKGLKKILYPLQLEELEDIIQAHLHLGFCYVLTNDPEKAEMEFEEALKLNPKLSLDPNFVPEKIIKIFQSVQEKQKKQEKEKWLKTLFIPFGLPEIGKGKKLKGYSLLVIETLSLATSILAYLANTKDADGDYPDYQKAYKLQQVQRIGLGIFCLAYLYGIGNKLKNKP
jgi:tetratricopeptide (TPR) repeat protein